LVSENSEDFKSTLRTQNQSFFSRFNKMAAEEPARAAYQHTFHHQLLASCQERVGIPGLDIAAP
jgi:hypothetical protein